MMSSNRSQSVRSCRRLDRRRTLAVLLMGLPLAASPIRSTPAEAVVSPIALVGRWTSSATHPTAGEMTVVVVIAQTLRFTGTATVQRRPFFEFGGTVRVSGRTLVWQYETSSIDLPDAARTDVDDIVSVDADQLVLKSRRSGAVHTLRRLR